jgi:hypothetical protein
MTRLKVVWLSLAVLFPAAMVVRNLRLDDGSTNWHYLFYIAPIYFLVMLAAGDRVFSKPCANTGLLLIDAGIIGGAALRMFPSLYYPPFSGHALFLSYVILSARMWPVQLVSVTYTILIILYKFDGLLISGEWIAGGLIGGALGGIHRFRVIKLRRKEQLNET